MSVRLHVAALPSLEPFPPQESKRSPGSHTQRGCSCRLARKVAEWPVGRIRDAGLAALGRLTSSPSSTPLHWLDRLVGSVSLAANAALPSSLPLPTLFLLLLWRAAGVREAACAASPSLQLCCHSRFESTSFCVLGRCRSSPRRLKRPILPGKAAGHFYSVLSEMYFT